MKVLRCHRPGIWPRERGLSFLPLLLGGALLANGCGGKVYVVSSLTPPPAIVIDGDATDWKGGLSYIASDQLFVGFANDRDDLFICMSREEAGGRPGAPTGGVTIWIDPAGGDKKTIGIRLAAASAMPEAPPKDQESDQDVPLASPDQEIEVLGPSGDVVRRFAAQAAAENGLEAKSSVSGGSTILEIRIPLLASEKRPVAVGAGPGGIIGVGFVSNRSGRDRSRAAPAGSGTGGAAGQPGGIGGAGVRGGIGGMQPGMRPNLNPDLGRALKVWTRVRLRQTEQTERSTILGWSVE